MGELVGDRHEGQRGLPHSIGQEGTWGVRKELKPITRSGKLVKEIPLRLSFNRAGLSWLSGWLLHELGVSLGSLAPSLSHFRQGCSSPAPPAAVPHTQALCRPPPLACLDSSPPPNFLPQRARGTDPKQVLEGREVSQARRGAWGEMGAVASVVTAQRKAPSCMAYWVPDCQEAAAMQEEGRAVSAGATTLGARLGSSWGRMGRCLVSVF